MKVLSRDFTTKEKVMLLILCLLLVGLAYYRFLWVPCTDAVSTANSQRESLQTELLTAMAKEKQLKKMSDELDALGELQETSRMESYNNTKAELTMLNSILETANDYSISFSGVTKDGDQIRRNFSLSFETDSFAAAKQIIALLSKSEYRCLLGDMQYSVALRRLGENETARVTRTVDDVVYAETVNVTTMATFFETMYGGTPDAGLPADKTA